MIKYSYVGIKFRWMIQNFLTHKYLLIIMPYYTLWSYSVLFGLVQVMHCKSLQGMENSTEETTRSFWQQVTINSFLLLSCDMMLWLKICQNNILVSSPDRRDKNGWEMTCIGNNGWVRNAVILCVIGNLSMNIDYNDNGDGKTDTVEMMMTDTILTKTTELS
jgi:hypothetical protein